jgi:large subunit ribosomal protein L21
VYAVIRTGSKQYVVSEGDVIKVERLAGEKGSNVELSEVLFVGGDGAPKIGSPRVDGAKVTAEVLDQAKAKKVLVYKKIRRKGYERLRGHRQYYTELKIKGIEA